MIEGKLISVGNHKLYHSIMGEDKGLPPVVLEHGCGSSALFWSLVAPEVAKVTQVIVYDRAGYGWSEPGPFPRTNEQCVTELYELLQQSGMKSPYLLVGHSYGGLNVRLFTGKYPGLVAGVVLVDSMHEDEVTARFPEEHVKGQILAARFYRALNLLSRTGLLKVLSALRSFPGFSATIKPFSKQTQELLWRLSFQKKTIAAMHSEFSNVQAGYEQVRELMQTYIPLTVIKSEIVNDFYPGTSEDTKRTIREKLWEVANELNRIISWGKFFWKKIAGVFIYSMRAIGAGEFTLRSEHCVNGLLQVYLYYRMMMYFEGAFADSQQKPLPPFRQKGPVQKNVVAPAGRIRVLCFAYPFGCRSESA